MTRTNTFADINKRICDPALGHVVNASAYFFDLLYTKEEILNELAALILAYEMKETNDSRKN